MFGLVLGRPGRRVFEPSYFLATSLRYHRRMVSGLTIPAMSARRRRPRTLPFTAKRRRWSSVRQSRRGPEDTVLLEQVVHDRLLVPVDPAGEEKEEEGERGRKRAHCRSVPHGPSQFKGCEPAISWARRSARRSRGASLLEGVDTPIFSEIRPRPSFRT